MSSPHKAMVLSVPGTGTRFLCQTILQRCLGYRQVQGRGFLDVPAHECAFTQKHFQVRAPQPTVYRGTRVVVPLRHPLYSFFNRYHTDGETPEQHAMRWYALFEYGEAYQIFGFAVDLGGYAARREVVEMLHNFLGRPDSINTAQTLHTLEHWEPVGATNNPHRTAHERDSTPFAGADLAPLQPVVARYEEMISEYAEVLHG